MKVIYKRLVVAGEETCSNVEHLNCIVTFKKPTWCRCIENITVRLLIINQEKNKRPLIVNGVVDLHVNSKSTALLEQSTKVSPPDHRLGLLS